MTGSVHARAREVPSSAKTNSGRRSRCSCWFPLFVITLAALLFAATVPGPWAGPAAAVLERARLMAEAASSSAAAAASTADRMIGASAVARRAADGFSHPDRAAAAVATLLQAAQDALRSGWEALRPVLSHVLHLGPPTCHSTPHEPPPQTAAAPDAWERAASGDGDGDGNQAPPAEAQPQRPPTPQQPDAGAAAAAAGHESRDVGGAGAEKKKKKVGGGKRKRARTPQP
jgi:hypothetical protein